MSLGYFGTPWAPGCESGEQHATPVGQLCLFCEEPIEEGSRGTFTTVIGETGTETRAHHIECALRAVVGGIGHLTDHGFWCELMHDPDAGLTFRESAVAVWDHANRNGLGELSG